MTFCEKLSYQMNEGSQSDDNIMMASYSGCKFLSFDDLSIAAWLATSWKFHNDRHISIIWTQPRSMQFNHTHSMHTMVGSRKMLILDSHFYPPPYGL
jgi:hypothetical protein